jgi:hypothetical protein
VPLKVHVPMSTLLDLHNPPAVVVGHGPGPGWLARTLLPDASLRRVAVNAATGIPLHIDPVAQHGRPPDTPPGPGPRRPPPPPDDGSDGAPAESLEAAQDQQARLLAMLRPVRLRDTTEPQHDPSAALRRLVQVRDLRCTGPGCPRTASSCDLDHEQEYAKGGPTSEPNLSAKSPRCHRAKHNGWTADRDRTTGITTWTSPDGSTFTRRPAWRPHPWHPEVVLPPLLRLQQLPEAETDYPLDRPLWIPPRLPERPRAAASTPAPPKPAGRSWDDGGPPPF